MARLRRAYEFDWFAQQPIPDVIQKKRPREALFGYLA